MAGALRHQAIQHASPETHSNADQRKDPPGARRVWISATSQEFKTAVTMEEQWRFLWEPNYGSSKLAICHTHLAI
jgi:hypothetical protein